MKIYHCHVCGCDHHESDVPSHDCIDALNLKIKELSQKLIDKDKMIGEFVDSAESAIKILQEFEPKWTKYHKLQITLDKVKLM